jgi:hypothetical protein
MVVKYNGMNPFKRVCSSAEPVKRIAFFIIKDKGEEETKEMENNLIPIFFDIEVYANTKGKHICYFVSYQRGNRTQTFYVLKCIQTFLDTIIQIPDEKLLVIEHNVSYDVCFIFNYLDIIRNNFIIIKKY